MTILLPKELRGLKPLMVIASELKRPWQAVLWDAVTNGRPIYVRFSDAVHETIDEVGKLTIDELSDFDTLSA